MSERLLVGSLWASGYMISSQQGRLATDVCRQQQSSVGKHISFRLEPSPLPHQPSHGRPTVLQLLIFGMPACADVSEEGAPA